MEIWFQRLTVPLLAWHAIRLRHRACRGRYLSATRSAEFLSRILFPGRTSAITEPLGQKDASGKNLRYLYERILWTILDQAINAEAAAPHAGEFPVEEWLKVLRSKLHYSLQETAKFLALGQHVAQRDSIARCHLLIIPAFPLCDRVDLKSLITTSGSQLSVRTWPTFVSLFPRLVALAILFAPLVKAIIGTATKPRSGDLASAGAGAGSGPTYLTEYTNSTFRRFPAAGQLSWFPHSGLQSSQVLVYFDRQDDSRYSAETRQAVESRGFGWLNMTSVLWHVPHPIRLALSSVWTSLKSLPFVAKKGRAWLWAISGYYRFVIASHESVISRYRVAAVHHGREFGPASLALALATRRHGAVTVWNHWSVDHYPAAHYNFAITDLLISWGPHNDGYFNAHNLSYRYLFQAGVFGGDGYDQSDADVAQAIRATLPPEVFFIVTAFDSTADMHTQHSPEMLREFYSGLVAYMERQAGVGVLIKSKGTALERLYLGPALSVRLQQLIASGRCRILPSDTRPAVAALAGQVSLCFSINTTGFQSAFVGRNTVHCDSPGNLDNPLIELGKGLPVVFSTVEQAIEAVDRFRRGDVNVGDHRPFLAEYSSFLDGKGSERVGEIIGRYMAARALGTDARRALEATAESYARRWGSQHVYPSTHRPFHRMDRLWKDIVTRNGLYVQRSIS